MPSAEAQLLEVRRSADRMLSVLLLFHVPAALGLAALHGTWIAAVLVAGVVSGARSCAQAERPWLRGRRRRGAQSGRAVRGIRALDQLRARRSRVAAIAEAAERAQLGAGFRPSA